MFRYDLFVRSLSSFLASIFSLFEVLMGCHVIASGSLLGSRCSTLGSAVRHGLSGGHWGIRFVAGVQALRRKSGASGLCSLTFRFGFE